MDFLTDEDQKLISDIKRKVDHLRSTWQDDPCVEVIYPPASQHEIKQVEAKIKLPPLIREIFLQVGNGGFGPGYGITGLLTGKQINNRTLVENVQNTVIEIKAHLRESIATAEQSLDANLRYIAQDKRHYDHWQQLGLDHLIWYCDWGCNIVTLVDFSRPDLPIYRADSLDVGADSSKTLREWWVQWLDDETME